MERTERSFKKNGKERNVLYKRMEKNGMNGTFFWKERMPIAQPWLISFDKSYCEVKFFILFKWTVWPLVQKSFGILISYFSSSILHLRISIRANCRGCRQYKILILQRWAEGCNFFPIFKAHCQKSTLISNQSHTVYTIHYTVLYIYCWMVVV